MQIMVGAHQMCDSLYMQQWQHFSNLIICFYVNNFQMTFSMVADTEVEF